MIRISAAEARRLSDLQCKNSAVEVILEDTYTAIEATASRLPDRQIVIVMHDVPKLSSVDVQFIVSALGQDGYIVSQDAGVMTISWARAV